MRLCARRGGRVHPIKSYEIKPACAVLIRLGQGSKGYGVGTGGAGKKFAMRDHVGFEVVARGRGGTRWDYGIRFMGVS